MRLFVGCPEKTTFELYDLSKDIHEDNDVSEQYPEMVKKIETLMQGARTESELFDFSRM